MNWGKHAMVTIVVRVDVVFLHSRSSGVLHSVEWRLVTEVSGQRTGAIFKGQVVYSSLEDGVERFSSKRH